MTEDQWSNILVDPNPESDHPPPGVETVLRVFAQATLSKGCKFPDPKSRVSAVAFLAVATGMQLSAEQAYALQKKYKDIITALRPSMEHVPYTLLDFPEQGTAFMRLFPNMYDETNPPVPCRVDVSAIHSLERVFPCRNTAMVHCQADN